MERKEKYRMKIENGKELIKKEYDLRIDELKK
jgi:hypothetical protein